MICFWTLKADILACILNELTQDDDWSSVSLKTSSWNILIVLLKLRAKLMLQTILLKDRQEKPFSLVVSVKPAGFFQFLINTDVTSDNSFFSFMESFGLDSNNSWMPRTASYFSRMVWSLMTSQARWNLKRTLKMTNVINPRCTCQSFNKFKTWTSSVGKTTTLPQKLLNPDIWHRCRKGNFLPRI